MPSEHMDQRRLSSMHLPLSFSSEESSLGSEKEVGFWKPELMPDRHGKEGMSLTSANTFAVSTRQNPFFKENDTKLGLEHLMSSERTTTPSMMSWKAMNGDLIHRYDLFGKESKANLNGVLQENGLFSSSLPNIFNRKLTFSTSGALPNRPDATKSITYDEPFESLEEIEAHTIGNLLPDDDELLSGVIDETEYIAQLNNNNEIEDDIFYSVGGMELEVDNISSNLLRRMENGLQGSHNSEDPSAEHPSRTLFVRNINSNVDGADLKVLFEQYGDVQSFHMACKGRRYIMISYYDIRSASNAMRALQNKPIMNKTFDIHYSSPKDNLIENDVDQATVVIFNIDSSFSNEDLHQIFGVYGEVKEIRETPDMHQRRFIEFYDIRDAQAAIQALKRSDIFGKQVIFESPFSDDSRQCLRQQFSQEIGKGIPKDHYQQENIYYNLSSQCYGKNPVRAVTSNGLKNRAVGPIIDASLSISSSIPHLSSPVRDAFVGSSNNNQPQNGELNNSMAQTNFGFQCMPNFHHSLPEYHNSLANDVLYNSPNTMSAMTLSIARHAELVDDKHMHRISPVGLINRPYEHIEGGNRSGPLHGHQYVPNSSNAFHRPPGPVMWSSSPSFVNSIASHPQTQMHGLPRAPSQMLNTVSPLHHHLVGSAPAVNPSLWDRINGYTGDSLDASAFQPGSLGNMGFSGNSLLHPREIASQNIFSHVGRNFMEPSISSPHGRLASPQQRSHMFHGRNPMIATPPTFDAPIDRIRTRRNDTSTNQADSKKQFELDVERIIRGEDNRTTLMIKNIPNKYTSKMLLATIDEHHRGTYDFIYLPIDFKNKCNVGYAFINMTDPQQIVPFYKAFNGKKWEKFNSEKVALLAYARIQGKGALIAHFQNSSLMNEDKRCRPILFHTDGPNAGDQEPFPMGVNIRSRPGRPKIYSNEDNHICSSPNSGNTGDTPKETDSSCGSVK